MKEILVNDQMQKNYIYFLTEDMGSNFHIDFNPELDPKTLLQLGIFGGKYMNDCFNEFPNDWFENASQSSLYKDIQKNFFKIDASMPLSHWKAKGWIYNDDPRGWFQWYCRYYMGRRLINEDLRQIKRWKSMRRHIGQITNNCQVGDLNCRKKQRQALLHWAYDSRII